MGHSALAADGEPGGRLPVAERSAFADGDCVWDGPGHSDGHSVYRCRHSDADTGAIADAGGDARAAALTGAVRFPVTPFHLTA